MKITGGEKMLEIIVPSVELWDEEKEEFVYTKEQKLQLEHSLISLSKWESKWCKAFFSKREKTTEETIDYIRCMTITENIDPTIYMCLTEDNVNQIEQYIEAPMTATYFPKENDNGISRETITSELIYYLMFSLNIPMECEKWHINRLITLIKVFGVKNQSPKKMSKSEIMNRNRALNEARKKQLNTKG